MREALGLPPGCRLSPSRDRLNGYFQNLQTPGVDLISIINTETHHPYDILSTGHHLHLVLNYYRDFFINKKIA